jgi:preprotein translocase subunit SecD
VASSTPVKKARRSLAWLGVLIIALLGVNIFGVLDRGWSWEPKLALDLEGGTQIILAPQVEGGQQVSQEQLNQAVAIIRQRVDAGGIAEAEIRTQGTNVVVAIAGEPDAATLDRIQSSAKLEFRPVLATAAAPMTSVGGDPASPTASPAPESTLSRTPPTTPSNPSDDAWITPYIQDVYDNFDCSTLDQSGANVAPAAEPLVTCDAVGAYKYILGPVEVAGETITNASAQTQTTQQGASTGVWEVAIEFNAEGTEKFAAVTKRLFAYGKSDVHNRFAIVLDGRIITAPTTNAVISNGKPAISGAFTQESAKTLADQLKFGALPIGFRVDNQEIISPTLGTSQLESGLIAGIIGLILVVIYSLFQYRLLGTVTILSLVVAAVITYLVINILGWRNGYRLSLAGVAGLIVAIGFTADSFIVYFERIRDELRDGRSLVAAVEAGWKRALRTIYAAKAVNLLSAVVLFLLTVGSVQGFALTLGLTTIIDVIVVVLFTHPILQLLATTRFFSSGHPVTGLDPNALGAVYRGRAQFRTPVVTAARNRGASKEAARRQTIAERKAAQEAAAPKGDSKSSRKDS